MHWTLLTMIALCGVCIAANAVQYMMVGSVRVSGILVCAAWALQETWWFVTGADNFVIMLVCDLLILKWLAHNSNGYADALIATLVPFTIALYVQQFVSGESALRWWVNWYVVAAQMILGLPCPWAQRIIFSVSHGSLRAGRRQEVCNGGTL